jgi:FtsZ-binding cell division protein ZapB
MNAQGLCSDSENLMQVVFELGNANEAVSKCVSLKAGEQAGLKLQESHFQDAERLYRERLQEVEALLGRMDKARQ